MELNLTLLAGVELNVGQRVEVEFMPPYGQPLRVRSRPRPQRL
jgi:hypothetical protein